LKQNTDSPEVPAATMEPTRDSQPRTKPPSAAKSQGTTRGSRLQRRRWARSLAHSTVRYFVGRPADPDAKPTLEEEVASEPEALVIAFKSDRRVYFITEYNVTQRIEGGQVRLEKQPAAAGHAVPNGVSTTNES